MSSKYAANRSRSTDSPSSSAVTLLLAHEQNTRVAGDRMTKDAEARKGSFLDLPPELRNMVYANCIQWPYIDISYLHRTNAFDGLSKIPTIAQEWSGYWYMNNIFLLDARGYFTCGDKRIDSKGYPAPIAAWTRWLGRLEKRGVVSLLRRIHIWTNFFAAKLYISDRPGGPDTRVELSFRYQGASIEGSRQGTELKKDLADKIGSFNEKHQGRRLEGKDDFDFLAKAVLSLYPLCCSILSEESRAELHADAEINPKHGVGRCWRCKGLRRYLT